MRFTFRMLSYLALAGAFVAFIVDGIGWVANGTFATTPLGATLFAAFPTTFPMLEPAITRHLHPLLWDPVLLTLFTTPSFVVLFVVAILCAWAGRPKAKPIGWSRDD
jgi:hypothetical protein